MPLPILLVTGFLGVGKTTLLNHLLTHAEGRRIAVMVNDFGAINIDAALLAGATDGVVSLANGCICCSLEGDLLRALANLLRRDPPPDAIVIETSGLAEPADIVRNLMDPVIAREASLDAVLCVLDAALPAHLLDDPLLRAQLRAADIVALSKTDLANPPDIARVRALAAATCPRAVIVEARHGHLPLALLFPDQPTPRAHEPGHRRPAADRFESLSWTSDHPISLPALQRAIERLAPRLARAKGLFEPADQPGRQIVFQLAGGRATLAPTRTTTTPSAQFVFIAELGALSPPEIAAIMEACTTTNTAS